MRIPLSWLREHVDVPTEPKRLAEDLTLVGLAVDALERAGEDWVLDLDITTNRVDCMNVYGVAREVSVLYDVPLRPLELAFGEAGPAAGEAVEVSVEAADLCPRFCARVLDVRLGPSPQWIRDRLETVGVRPINNVVDLTNYVMLEMGHPSHAFDLARIPGQHLKVRWARGGERLRTLDGAERALSGRMGVVAGEDAALALAGVMGGVSSEVSESTRTVVLEAAYWDPLSIRRTAKALGMHTEASHRFERGADPEGPLAATARIGHLLEKIGAGSVRPGLIDRHVAPRPRRETTLRDSRLAAVLGASVPEARARGILQGLGFRIRSRRGGATTVTIPTWRGDVTREVDLIEEVGRHHGLARIPSTIPPSRGVEGLRPAQTRERAIRDALVGAGLTEVINHAFVPAAGPAPSSRLPLENPLSEEQGLLRDSIVLPGLLATLRTNLRHGRRDVHVFEIGRVFSPGDDVPREERRLGIALAGTARPGHWSEKRAPVDFFDLKGILEALASRLAVEGLGFTRDAEVPPFLHPGQSAAVRGLGRGLGFAGALHPDVAEAWELRDETVVAELTLEPILSERPPPVRFRALDRFPAVTRDLSILCGAAEPAAAIESRIRAAGGERLRAVALVDRYDGTPVPKGKVSLTVTLRFQDPARTLTSEEVQASVERIIHELRQSGAEIRGE